MTRLWKRSILHVNSSKVIFSQNDIGADKQSIPHCNIEKDFVVYIRWKSTFKSSLFGSTFFGSFERTKRLKCANFGLLCRFNFRKSKKLDGEVRVKKIDREVDCEWIGMCVCEIKENKWDKDALCLKQVNLHAIWN